MASDLKPVLRFLSKNLVILLGVFLFVLTPCVQAEDTLDPVRAFWSNKLPDSQQLKTSYSNLSTKPFGREDLAFSLLVPSDWKDTKVTVKAGQLELDTQNWIPLTLQVAPDEEKSEAIIQVVYIRLDLEMSLSDYVDQHIETNNYTVLLRRQGVYNRRQVEEVLVRSGDQIVRLTFSRHGDRIFVVSGSSLESAYQGHAKSFAAAAVSFTVQKESPQPFANPMTNFSSAKAPKLKFKYPQDWELEEVQDQPAGQTGVEVRIAVPNEKGQMMTYGYMYIQGYDKSTGKTPVQVMSDMRKALESKPITFQKKTLKVDLAPKQEEPLSKLERFRVTVKGTPAEVAMLIMPRQSDLLAMSLVIPHREDNLLAWMHGWRVFEIVAGDLVGQDVPISHVKNLILPSNDQLSKLVTHTMVNFANAAQKSDFSDLYENLSVLFKIQTSPGRLRSAFSGFANQKELAQISQHNPTFTKDSWIDSDGLLEVEGHFPTTPEATTFKLKYLYEKPEWRLLGINVAMK